jgi:hypothetical protein
MDRIDEIVQGFDKQLEQMPLLQMLANDGRKTMQMKHWAWMLIVLVIGYYLGTKYPNILSSVGA